MKNTLLLLLVLISFDSFSQTHKRKKFRYKSRIVADNHYRSENDSSQFSTEIFFANANTWTGETYNYNPSLQFLFSYDNKKKINAGLFFCLNKQGFEGPGELSNGADIFVAYSLKKRLTLVLDAYVFLNKNDSLQDFFGYKAKVYNLYSSRLEYEFNKRVDLILGYSVLNNTCKFEHSLSFEIDYQLIEPITLVVSYSIDPNTFNFRQGVISPGIGFTGAFKKRFNLGITFNPVLYNARTPYYTPLSFVLSTKLENSLKK